MTERKSLEPTLEYAGEPIVGVVVLASVACTYSLAVLATFLTTHLV